MAVTDILTQIDVAPGLSHPAIDVPDSPGRQRADSRKRFARSLEQAQQRKTGGRPKPPADNDTAPPSTSTAVARSHSDRDRSSSKTARPAEKNESSRTEKQPATDVYAKRKQEVERGRSEANEAELSPPPVESESNGDRQIERSPLPALATQITQTIAETLDLPEPPASLPAFLSVEAAGESLDLTNEHGGTPADGVPLPPPGLFQTLATQTTDSDVGEFATSAATREAPQPFERLFLPGVGIPDTVADGPSKDGIASGGVETLAPSSSLNASGAQALSEAIAAGPVGPQESSTTDPLATAVIADTVNLDAPTTVSAIPLTAQISASGVPDGPAPGEFLHVEAESESAGDAEIGSNETFEVSVGANRGSNLAVQQNSTAAETIAALEQSSGAAAKTAVGNGPAEVSAGANRGSNLAVQQSSTAAATIAALGQSSGTAAKTAVGDGPAETATAPTNGPQAKPAQSSTAVNNLNSAGAAKPVQAEAVVEVQPSVPHDTKTSQTIARVSQAVRSAHVHGRPLRVRLHPPELGTVQVEVVNRNGHLIARLDVQTTSAHRMILDNMGLLHEALAQQGTSIERVDVHLADNSDTDNPPDFSEQQENDSQQDGTQQEAQRDHEQAANGPDESDAEQPARSRRATMDQLDVQV